MPLKKRRGPPAGSGPSSEIIAAVNSDGSDHSLSIPISQLNPRPVSPDEIPELRSMCWRQAALGHRLPSELDVIVIRGGER